MNDIGIFESREENPIDETEDDLCRALWIAVAIQAIIDASSKSKKKSAIKERSSALQWLSDNADEESDLAWVCDLAEIDFRELRKRFKKSLRNPADSIDFRCLKKAGIEIAALNRENDILQEPERMSVSDRNEPPHKAKPPNRFLSFLPAAN